METTKKTTLSTLKSFIRKNEGRLFIKVGSSFSGMSDCVETISGAEFAPAKSSSLYAENSLGVAGAWFVGGSRDWFQKFENETLTGYRVSNSCGSFTLAIQK